jgi:8-oxo-dGTP pyrophosphatase MutT (NUDIX family)
MEPALLRRALGRTLDLPAAPPPDIAAEAVAAPAGTREAAALAPGDQIPAAVLVALLSGPTPGVLLTVRAATLSRHPGQVAFPGGRIEASDATIEAAALREAEEEVGIPPASVELLGRLPDHVTGTGFRVSPVVGILPAATPLRPSADEVAATFVLPLSVLLDPAAPRRETMLLRGVPRAFWVWPHETHRIWGATAAILVALADKLRAGGAAP